MEKYSRWADLTTGINPFVPHKQRFGDSLPARAARVLSGAALALVRLPLVAVVGVVAAVLSAVTSVLAPVPLLGRPLKRLVDWLLCALLLLILGVLVTEEGADTRRLGLSAAKGKARATDTRVRRGDVIVCNHTSFLEVLVLAKRFSPAFVFVSDESASKGLVRVCGLPGAVFRALAAPLGPLDSSAQKLEDVVKNARGPVVVFAEGARSNGKSVLAFVPVLQRLPAETTRIHLVAFRYEFKSFSPSQSAGSGWRHYLWTSFRPYHSLKMSVLSAGDLDLTAGSKVAAKATDASTLTTAQVEKLRGLLAAMLRTKTVGLGVRDFVSFNAYWAHVTSGGRRPAAEFTDRKAPHEHAQWTKR